MKPWYTRTATARQARTADQAAIETFHIPSLVLMENAARAAFDAISHNLPAKPVAVVCGPGNNGADGLALARQLTLAGIKTDVFVDENRLSHDGAIHFASLISLIQAGTGTLHLYPASETVLSSSELNQRYGLVVDALFGNGLSRPIRAPYSTWIEAINSCGAPVLSIDLPSGIHSDTGQQMGCSIEADQTIALDCLKWGHLLGQGRIASGEVKAVDIGIPSFLHEHDGSIAIMNEQMAASFLPWRRLNANKGTFGRVLMCGGSLQMQGALTMAAKACFACGCGTLTLFAPQKAAQAIASKLDLAMIIAALEDSSGFFSEKAGEELAGTAGKWSVLSCGNGMGCKDGALSVLKNVLVSSRPCIVDADGITLLAQHPDLLGKPQDIILTPHMKEFARLCHISLDEALHHPFEHGKELIRKYPQITLVIKSDFTLVMNHDQALIINRPDPALAKGGSGDVLCGIITSLRAQGLSSFEAAALGAWIHNDAAREKISSRSFSPAVLIENLPHVFARLDAARDRMESRPDHQHTC